MTCCTGNCNQGRACPTPRHATRTKFGLPPLHQQDGGHEVIGAKSFPIEREEDDEPLYTPASVTKPLPNLRDAFVGFLVLLALAGGAFALVANH